MKVIFRIFNIVVFCLSLAIVFFVSNKKADKKSPADGTVKLLLSEFEVTAYNLKTDVGDLEEIYKTNPSQLPFKVSELGDKALRVRRRLDLMNSIVRDITKSFETQIKLSGNVKEVKQKTKALLVEIEKLKSSSQHQEEITPRLAAALGDTKGLSVQTLDDLVGRVVNLKETSLALQQYIIDVSKLLDTPSPDFTSSSAAGYANSLMKSQAVLKQILASHQAANQQFAELKTKVINLEEDNKGLRQKVTTLQREILVTEKQLKRLQ